MCSNPAATRSRRHRCLSYVSRHRRGVSWHQISIRLNIRYQTGTSSGLLAVNLPSICAPFATPFQPKRHARTKSSVWLRQDTFYFRVCSAHACCSAAYPLQQARCQYMSPNAAALSGYALLYQTFWAQQCFIEGEYVDRILSLGHMTNAVQVQKACNAGQTRKVKRDDLYDIITAEPAALKLRCSTASHSPVSIDSPPCRAGLSRCKQPVTQ